MAHLSSVTLQAWLETEWADIARLDFPAPDAGPFGHCLFEYDLDHFSACVGRDNPLVQASLNLPLTFGPTMCAAWPAFLDDIRPMGSARGWWLRRLGLPHGPASDFQLLRDGTVAPIGHLRIKESVPPRVTTVDRFDRQLIVDRAHHFLEYAASVGAPIGGATGAGGDSPKLLVRLDSANQGWIDTWQDQPDVADSHFLVKFARGSRSERDQIILRSEHVYYRALHALGVETISLEGMTLLEGEHGPSLWLPRFDVARENGREVRLGVESVYSLMGALPGSSLKHEDVLPKLQSLLPQPTRETALEYLRRELVNVVFGNSDNHGRNSAVLKSRSGLRLAPVYDFAPMVMDPEGIIRSTRWRSYEKGEIDWAAVLEHFGRDEEFLRAGLGELAQRLSTLPDLLTSLGLPAETLNHPPLGLARTKQKLVTWGLL